MRFPDSLRAREPRAAAHSIVLIMGVSTVVLALLTTFGPNSVSGATRSASWAGVAALVAVIAVCVLVPADHLDRAGAFAVLGLGGVLLTCVLNVLTDDPSAGGQAFLAFPVLWAASHLRWAAVALVTGAAVVGDGITQLVLQPVEPAVHDLLVVGSVLVVAAVILLRAASMQDRLVSALQRQADVDPLTGLVTRRVLDDALTGALERDPTGDGTALVLLDIDSFKQINDGHGHPVGDDALVHLSGLVRRQVRAGDAVVGRLGGDELALLLPGCTAGTAARRAGELVDTVRASPLPRADGDALPLSISVGVAHAPLHAASVRELYAAADAALYRAKRAGRDRVEVAVSSDPRPADGLPRQPSAR
ncbi:GGDEF domain-containing protein [Geodermatophilus sp. URMC 60]